MLIHRGLWIGDFEITASAIQLGEPPGCRGVGGQCAAHKAGLQGALPCCPCLVAPMLVAACSRLQLEWPASLATGQLRSPQDLDTHSTLFPEGPRTLGRYQLEEGKDRGPFGEGPWNDEKGPPP